MMHQSAKHAAVFGGWFNLLVRFIKAEHTDIHLEFVFPFDFRENREMEIGEIYLKLDTEAARCFWDFVL